MEATTSRMLKETILRHIITHRIATRQILSRGQGEVLEAVDDENAKLQILAKAGDGRYLYMPALDDDGIRMVLRQQLPCSSKAKLGCEATRDLVSDSLGADIRENGFEVYLKEGQHIETLRFEEQVNICAQGILIQTYYRRVPAQADAAAAAAA